MATQAVSVGWSEETLPIGTHACFYYSDEPGLRRTLEFLRVGLDKPGDLCVIFADESRHEALLGWLQQGYSGSVQDRLAEGKLALIGGAPTTAELMARIGGRLDAAMKAGTRAIRFLGFIAWGQPGWPDEESLLFFESAVNNVVTAYPAVIVCTYGVPNLDGSQLINGGLQTHPVVFLNDRAVSGNPFYIAPARE